MPTAVPRVSVHWYTCRASTTQRLLQCNMGWAHLFEDSSKCYAANSLTCPYECDYACTSRSSPIAATLPLTPTSSPAEHPRENDDSGSSLTPTPETSPGITKSKQVLQHHPGGIPAVTGSEEEASIAFSPVGGNLRLNHVSSMIQLRLPHDHRVCP